MERLIFLFLSLVSFSFAELRVVVTYPWIGELVREVGADRVELYVIAKGTEDPHFVIPKPSHIAKLRSADLLVIQGAQLEAGFLPPLLLQSNNPKIQPGSEGFLDLSSFVRLIEKPEVISRAMGDVHPEGNPHYNLDPHNMPVLARAVKERLCQLDGEGCTLYEGRLKDFLGRWEERLKSWDKGFSALKGVKVVAYHSLFNYLLKRYGIVLLETLEPLPGIPPTRDHIQRLINLKGVRSILLGVYNEERTARFVAGRIGARVVVLPHDVGSIPEVKDLFSLYDELLRRLKGD
ncbi:zinc/manganese transport system substrate-binding protein [Hydrogenivirga caldilitoris]|uniref:Zinc/manganese transport system substrate-binding protein n=1 Tax=Hydrogenivirga caldilitoris TaxID=246264 RepID=A0A497XNZ4_9AQUI|nr:zinc ABC transporter substrate-binding protein [Hydrogenivirga caldilitoris]RLJ69839.1 zinc/manganese transport system substrate-binding protein [Hydrogenivirga caldilitoris]